MTTTLEQLPVKINTVLEQDAAATAAKQNELEAQTALVTRILEMLRPAVRALGTRPLIADSYRSGADDVTRGEKRAGWRGICLTGKPRPSRRRGGGEDTNGSYEGEDIFLREDGQLIALVYSGHWDNWQGHHNEWQATEGERTVEEFCRDWANAEPEQLLEDIVKLMDKAGDRARATEAANRRADKFRALLALAGK